MKYETMFEWTKPNEHNHSSYFISRFKVLELFKYINEFELMYGPEESVNIDYKEFIISMIKDTTIVNILNNAKLSIKQKFKYYIDGYYNTC